MKHKLNQCIGCAFLLLSCSLLGQGVQKKELTAADYNKWGTLAIKELSELGNWVSYSMNYSTKTDTLFLQNTLSEKSRAYPMGQKPSFAGERFFAFMTGDELTVSNLQSGTVKKTKEVSWYALPLKGKYLLTVDKENVLKVNNEADKVLEKITGLTEYKLTEEGTGLVYVQTVNNEYQVGWIDFTKYKNTILAKSSNPITRITWQEEGQMVAFMDGKDLSCCLLATKIIYKLPQEALAAIAVQPKVSSYGPIVVSHDGEKVFFSLESTLVLQDNTSVEVWNANDTCLYPAQKQGASQVSPKLAVWFPKTGNYKLLSDEVLSGKYLSGMQNYALLWDTYSYGLVTSYPEYVDYYLKDVRTGAEKVFLKKQSRIQNQVCFAPKSNAIAYYRDTQWWFYSPEADTTVCLTNTVKTNWDNTSLDAPHQFRIHGVAGWTQDGKSILLYDEYDIWKAALNGGSCVRLTKGRETSTVYRISDLEKENSSLGNYENINIPRVNLNRPIVLELKNRNDWSTGYAVYDEKKGIRILEYRAATLRAIKKSINGKYAFTSETFEESPSLNFVALGDKKVKELFKSNKQEQQYYWGTSELIQYRNSDGVPLKAALFYPAKYDPAKKYPMIVNIYDQLSKKVYHHDNPKMHTTAGHAITNITSEGYFVLYPDIAYTLGNTGFSATECVIAATKAALKKAAIDEKRLGLMGHSFGGYQTNFILTQTSIFAAAVSGAGVSDPIGRYFGLSDRLVNKDEMWRYESQQFRMGSSFFENKQGYLQNAPIMGADKITTPLLLWSGKKDTVIPFQQSVTLYMALRRLGSKSILLAYPEEDHTLSNPENQTDLTLRIMQWFNYFLKDKKDTGWITKGTSEE